MSITFKLEIEGNSEEVNFSNGNAAALLILAGLQSAPYGEITHERLEAVITKVAPSPELRTCARARGHVGHRRPAVVGGCAHR